MRGCLFLFHKSFSSTSNVVRDTGRRIICTKSPKIYDSLISVYMHALPNCISNVLVILGSFAFGKNSLELIELSSINKVSKYQV